MIYNQHSVRFTVFKKVYLDPISTLHFIDLKKDVPFLHSGNTKYLCQNEVHAQDFIVLAVDFGL